MRWLLNGRGLPPLVDEYTLHGWACDETAATDSLMDLVGGQNLPDYSSPGVPSGDFSPVGGYRSGDGSADYFEGGDPGADETEMLADWTVEALLRLDPDYTDDGLLCGYFNAGSTEADNQLCWLEFEDDTRTGDEADFANLKVRHEYGSSPATAEYTFDFDFEVGHWYYIAVSKVTSGANCVYYLYVNGSLVDSSGDLTKPTSSSGVQDWGVLGRSGSEWLAAKLAYLFVSATTRTAAEIRINYRRALQLETYSLVHHRVDVENGASSYVNLSALGGEDWRDSVSISDGEDDRIQVAAVKVAREVYNKTLAKWFDNKMNRVPLEDSASPGPDDTTYGNPNAGTCTELLDIGRGIKIYIARCPMDTTPSSTDWNLWHEGEIDAIDWGDDPIKIRSRDLAAPLAMAYIEDADYEIAPANTGACSTQDGDTHANVEDVMDDLLSEADTNNWFAGTAPTVYAPVTPGWCVRNRVADRVPIMQFLTDMADQIGWVCRYRWDPASETFKLTLYEPVRSQDYADGHIEPADYGSAGLSLVSMDRANIRNVVRVVIASHDQISPTGSFSGSGGGISGQPANGYVEISDSDSITKYGRQFCEITEGSVSNIDTTAEAQTLAQNILDDLCEPEVSMQLELLHPIPEFSVHDMLAITPNDQHMDTSLELAVFRHDLALSADGGTSRYQLRGRPSSGVGRHLAREVRTSGAQTPAIHPTDYNVPRARHHNLRARRDAQDSGLGRSGRRGLVVNPAFEWMSYGPGHIFDKWTQSGGTWGTNVLRETTVKLSGQHSLRLTSVAPVVYSAPFEVSGGDVLQLEVLAYRSTSTGTLAIGFETDTEIHFGDSPAVDSDSKTLVNTTWRKFKHQVEVPAGDRYARVYMRAVAISGSIYVDRVDACVMAPSFSASLASDQSVSSDTDWVDVQLAEDSDPGGNFASYTFTAPENGLYRFDAVIAADDLTEGGLVQSRIVQNGSTPLGYAAVVALAGALSPVGGATPWAYISYGGERELSAGDTVKLQIRSAADGTYEILTGSRLTGRLITQE